MGCVVVDKAVWIATGEGASGRRGVSVRSSGVTKLSGHGEKDGSKVKERDPA